LRPFPRTAVLLLALLGPPAGAATIEVVGDQAILSGSIDGSELARFKDVSAAHGDRIRTVILRDSPGGDLWTSTRVAEFIRDRKWRTAVSGYCFSGCALMYLGGVTRHFTDDKPATQTQLGFHATYHTTDNQRGAKGSVHEQQTWATRHWIRQHTEGKISEAMLDRFEQLAQSDFLHFFDSSRLPRPGQVSVFTCPRDRESKRKCEAIPGFDVYREGIATSTEVMRSNDRPAASSGGPAAAPSPTPPAPAK
jgi:hypothetical protein